MAMIIASSIFIALQNTASGDRLDVVLFEGVASSSADLDCVVDDER
jgi:hypothetical protein